MTEAEFKQIADLKQVAGQGSLVDFGRNDAARGAKTDPVPIEWR